MRLRGSPRSKRHCPTVCDIAGRRDELRDFYRLHNASLVDKVECILPGDGQADLAGLSASLRSRYQAVPLGWEALGVEPTATNPRRNRYTCIGWVLLLAACCMYGILFVTYVGFDLSFMYRVSQLEGPITPFRRRSRAKIASLRKWIHKHGGDCSRAVVKDSGGLEAAVSLPANTMVAAVPRELLLDSWHAKKLMIQFLREKLFDNGVQGQDYENNEWGAEIQRLFGVLQLNSHFVLTLAILLQRGEPHRLTHPDDPTRFDRW
jgi:hypothetical protein